MESLEAFYKRKFDFVPEHLRSGIGHFNVFQLDPFVGEKAKPAPYKRRDFYKISCCKKIVHCMYLCDLNLKRTIFSNSRFKKK